MRHRQVTGPLDTALGMQRNKSQSRIAAVTLSQILITLHMTSGRRLHGMSSLSMLAGAL